MAPQDAEDLAESCVIDVALRASRYDPTRRGSFVGWAIRVADRLRIGATRRQWPTLAPFEFDVPDPQAEAALLAIEKHAYHAALEAAMDRLKGPDQAVLRARGLDDERSFEDVAASLGIAPATARQRHSRARKRLIEKLRSDLGTRELASEAF